MTHDLPKIPALSEVVAFAHLTPKFLQGAAPACHGLVLTGDGGLGLLTEGSGLMLILSPEMLRALAYVALGVADQVEAARDAIKARADQALEKVISEHPLHSLPRESFGNA